MAWINEETGFYSVGDQQPGQIEVPERKNPTDAWVNGAWVAGPLLAPNSVTPFQAIQALNAFGKLAQVEAAVAGADKITQYAWSRATSFDRDSDIVKTLASGFGWTEGDLDALFSHAATFV
jgi:hypothetical protein